MGDTLKSKKSYEVWPHLKEHFDLSQEISSQKINALKSDPPTGIPKKVTPYRNTQKIMTSPR